MPGYTHLQSAQPIRWGHWMLSHAWAWKRDGDRLAQIVARMNEVPLGSGALSGNPFGVDREALAADLGLRGRRQLARRVADRDFVIELIGWGALLMAHLALRRGPHRLRHAGFGFVKLADACAARNSSRRAFSPREFAQIRRRACPPPRSGTPPARR